MTQEFSAVPVERSHEIYLAPLEMMGIAETAKECVAMALDHSHTVVGDRSMYRGIPHHNQLRPAGIVLDLQNIRFSSLDINLPRKDTDLRIQIVGHASGFKNRTLTFQEKTKTTDPLDRPDFFVDDSHNRHWVRAGSRPIKPIVSHEDVARWLYMQAGIDVKGIEHKLATETDPVRNACDFLSTRASNHATVREIKVALSPDLEFHAQVTEDHNVSDPTKHPDARLYAAWITQDHVISGEPVTERLIVQFSPDDVLLGLEQSNISSAQVSVESSSPNYDIGRAVVRQALAYEGGNVEDAFIKIQKRLATYFKNSSVTTPEQL